MAILLAALLAALAGTQETASHEAHPPASHAPAAVPAPAEQEDGAHQETPATGAGAERPDSQAESRSDGSHGHSEGPSAQPAALPERLCGPLPRKTLRWNPKDGALRLGGRLVVGPGQSLELPPGTLVVADPDASCRDSTGATSLPSLLVAGGTLRVAGTWRDPVVLRPLREGSDLPWEGIQAAGAAEGAVSLRWLEIRRARTGIGISVGTASIDHAVIEGCGIGMGVVGGATPRVVHSVFSRSRVADVASERSAPRFRSCLFLDGHGDGIRFSGTGLARVETSLFWGHAGIPVVRGTGGLGAWKADSLPDRYGNRHCDPVLRGTRAASDSAARVERENARASWWKRRRLPPAPPGKGPWVPSAFSPLLGAGERRVGGRADIGLWDELRE